MAKTSPKPPRSKGRKRRILSNHFGLAAMIIFSLFCSLFILNRQSAPRHSLSKDQVKLEIQKAAEKNGISDHLKQLYAIVQVESNWRLDDVFQSSESLGLNPNTLGIYDSIEQGCAYYKSLLERAEKLGIEDQDAIFQAYNFGIGYLDYIASHGKKHTRELAQEFSRQYAHGRIVSYPNPIALEVNGGWRYDYGNMFYVDLIHQALENQ